MSSQLLRPSSSFPAGSTQRVWSLCPETPNAVLLAGQLPGEGWPPSHRGSRAYPAPLHPFLGTALSFSCLLPGGGRYGSLVGALASGREASGTFVTLFAAGSPWSAVMAHVWGVCMTSFLLIGCDSSRPHSLEQHSPS